MTARLEFFPVGNGDMALLTLQSGKRILIDVNIRKDADDEDNDDVPDVATMLRERLETDNDGRKYVDAFLLSHPDADHCRGLDRHFHLGAPSAYDKKEDKIFVREMWSSPIIFRRKHEIDGTLCDDAEAWWAEARRRVKAYKDAADKSAIVDGNRIQILGEDKGGKTDELADILVKCDGEITKVCGAADGTFRARLLAPHLVTDEEAEELSGKNHSSVVVRFDIKSGDTADAGKFLIGGDAEVENWDRVWNRNKKQPDRLIYNILLSPHHCSWHSLSYDSWSEKKEKAKVDADARSALSQARNKAFIVASSNEIMDDDVDPPCIRAKREYEDIAKGCKGTFLCVADEAKEDVLLFDITDAGPTRGKTVKKSSGGSGGPVIVTGGTKPRESEKRGGGRYA